MNDANTFHTTMTVECWWAGVLTTLVALSLNGQVKLLVINLISDDPKDTVTQIRQILVYSTQLVWCWRMPLALSLVALDRCVQIEQYAGGGDRSRERPHFRFPWQSNKGRGGVLVRNIGS